MGFWSSLFRKKKQQVNRFPLPSRYSAAVGRLAAKRGCSIYDLDLRDDNVILGLILFGLVLSEDQSYWADDPDWTSDTTTAPGLSTEEYEQQFLDKGYTKDPRTGVLTGPGVDISEQNTMAEVTLEVPDVKPDGMSTEYYEELKGYIGKVGYIGYVKDPNIDSNKEEPTVKETGGAKTVDVGQDVMTKPTADVLLDPPSFPDLAPTPERSSRTNETSESSWSSDSDDGSDD